MWTLDYHPDVHPTLVSFGRLGFQLCRELGGKEFT